MKVFLPEGEISFYKGLTADQKSRVHDRLRHEGFSIQEGFVFVVVKEGEHDCVSDLSRAFARALECEDLYDRVEHLFGLLARKARKEFLSINLELVCPEWPPHAPLSLELLECIHASLDEFLLQNKAPNSGCMSAHDQRIAGILSGLGKLSKEYDCSSSLISLACGIIGAEKTSTMEAFTAKLIEGITERQMRALESFVGCAKGDIRIDLLRMWHDRKKMTITQEGIIAGLCGFKDTNWNLQKISYAILDMDERTKKILQVFLKEL